MIADQANFGNFALGIILLSLTAVPVAKPRFRVDTPDGLHLIVFSDASIRAFDHSCRDVVVPERLRVEIEQGQLFLSGDLVPGRYSILDFKGGRSAVLHESYLRSSPTNIVFYRRPPPMLDLAEQRTLSFSMRVINHTNALLDSVTTTVGFLDPETGAFIERAQSSDPQPSFAISLNECDLGERHLAVRAAITLTSTASRPLHFIRTRTADVTVKDGARASPAADCPREAPPEPSERIAWRSDVACALGTFDEVVDALSRGTAVVPRDAGVAGDTDAEPRAVPDSGPVLEWAAVDAGFVPEPAEKSVFNPCGPSEATAPWKCPEQPPCSSIEKERHVVVSRENLWSIAERLAGREYETRFVMLGLYCVNQEVIFQARQTHNPGCLPRGLELCIPPVDILQRLGRDVIFTPSR